MDRHATVSTTAVNMAFFLICAVCVIFPQLSVGQQSPCLGASSLPSVAFLSPLHDTTISVKTSGELATEVLICGLDDRQMSVRQLIVYLNSNIVHKERVSIGVVRTNTVFIPKTICTLKR